MAEHAGRLATLLAAYADPDTEIVGPQAMAGGIELAKHYADELLRLQGSAKVFSDLQMAARLLEWWKAQQDPRCHLAVIYQRSLNAIRGAATARRVVDILLEHGWIEALPSGVVLDGKARADAWAFRQ